MQSISDQIRQALSRTDRPQVDIARAAGIHVVNLSQFKSKRRELPVKNLEAIAAELGFEIVLKRKK